MSTSNDTTGSKTPPGDKLICEAYPSPIAAAWRGALSVGTDAESLLQMLQVPEVVLRTLCAFLLPDYLGGAPDPAVEEQLQRLQRPSQGQWVALLRLLVNSLAGREAPAPFLPQALGWYGHVPGHPSAEALRIDRLIEARNRHAHRGSSQSREGIEEEARLLKVQTRELLQGLSWTMELSLLRVLSQEPTRDGATRGRVQVYRGAAETPIAEDARWRARLVAGALYLLSAERDTILETSPFLQVRLHGPSRQDRLFLFKASRPGKGLKLAHDPSQVELEGPILTGEREETFDEWLKGRSRWDPRQRDVVFHEPESLARIAPQVAPELVVSLHETPSVAAPENPRVPTHRRPGMIALLSLLGLTLLSLALWRGLAPSQQLSSAETPTEEARSEPQPGPLSAAEPEMSADPLLTLSPPSEQAINSSTRPTASSARAPTPRAPSSEPAQASLEPTPLSDSEGAKKPGESAPASATILLRTRGSVRGAVLIDAQGSELPSGQVPPGNYRVKAVFGGEAAVVSDQIYRVVGGQTLVLQCSSFNTRCAPVESN